MPTEDRRLGTCASLQVRPDADGKVRVRKAYAYSCIAHVDAPAFPDSINFNFEHAVRSGRRRMEPHDGVACPFWVNRRS